MYIGGVFRAYTLHGSRHTELYKKIMPLRRLPARSAPGPARIAAHRASPIGIAHRPIRDRPDRPCPAVHPRRTAVLYRTIVER